MVVRPCTHSTLAFVLLGAAITGLGCGPAIDAQLDEAQALELKSFYVEILAAQRRRRSPKGEAVPK